MQCWLLLICTVNNSKVYIVQEIYYEFSERYHSVKKIKLTETGSVVNIYFLMIVVNRFFLNLYSCQKLWRDSKFNFWGRILHNSLTD